MKKKFLLSAVSVALIGMSIAGSANAALLERLGGLAYYDTDADLTWLADANYAQTSGYNPDPASNGQMTWKVANAWAANLTVGTASGWRLPDTIDVDNDGATYTNVYQGVDFGYNITTHSELSNMFYNVLGNTAYYDTSGTETGCTAPTFCLTNTGPFSNLQPGNYWSDTELALGSPNAWVFNMSDGFQVNNNKENSYYGWAVQSGDVSAVPGTVPVPAAVWLFGSGLLGLVGVARRRTTI